MIVTMWFKPISNEGEEDAAPYFGHVCIIKPAGGLSFAKHLYSNDIPNSPVDVEDKEPEPNQDDAIISQALEGPVTTEDEEPDPNQDDAIIAQALEETLQKDKSRNKQIPKRKQRNGKKIGSRKSRAV